MTNLVYDTQGQFGSDRRWYSSNFGLVREASYSTNSKFSALLLNLDEGGKWVINKMAGSGHSGCFLLKDQFVL